MKITQLKPNYKSNQIKPESQKQVASNNINVDEKQVFKFLSANPITFKGTEKPLNNAFPGAEENAEEIKQLFKRMAWEYTYVEKFKELISNPNFDYSLIKDALAEKFKTSNDSQYETKRGMRSELYAKMLLESEKLPDEINEYFTNKSNYSDFFYYWGKYNKEKPGFEQKAEKVIKKLIKDFNFNVNENPNILSCETKAYGGGCYEIARVLYNEGANPFVEGASGNPFNDNIFTDNVKNINNALNSGIITSCFIHFLRYGKINLDDIDGKNIEALINEKIKDENIKSQLLTSIKTLREMKNPTLSNNDKRLLELVNSKNSSELQEFLETSPTVNINMRDKNGEPLTFIAYDKHDYKTYKLLIQHPDIDLNTPDVYGKTLAMHISKKTFNEDILFLDEIFIDRLKDPSKFNPNYVNYLTATPSTMLTVANNKNMLKELLTVKGVDINFKTSTMDPAIIYYIKNPNSERFKAIASQLDANLDITGIDGNNIKQTIKKHVRKDDEKYFYNALRSAKNEQTFKNFKKLVNTAGTPDVKTLQSYLDYPDILNIVNRTLNTYDETITHILAEYRVSDKNKEEIEKLFEKLITAKADLNKQDRFGLTPLMKAVNAQNVVAIEFLLNNGADKFIKNNADITAAKMAIELNNPEINELFIKY